MPYRKEQFANDEIYHIILRGLDDKLIFKDINDYYRGIFSIYEFNNANRIEIRKRREQIKNRKKKVGGVPDSAIDERDKLVDVLCFCFMPNHVHLLLKQKRDGGIVKFMNKIGSGYAGYFNRKYERKGYVFQNRFRSVPIKDDNQLRVIFNYIHVNPISLIEPGWKEKGIRNLDEVISFLEDYKWSSYSDYIGEKNFPSVTERDFLSEILNGVVGCREAIEDWVKYKEEMIRVQNILLE
jgi:putative transposase